MANIDITQNYTLPYPSGLQVVLLPIGLFLLGVFIFVGNFMTVLSIFLNKKLRSVTNAFITSLALGDLLIPLLVIPLLLVSDLIGPTLPVLEGLKWCHFTISITLTIIITSVGNLVAVSLDRYLALAKPLTYQSHSTVQRAGIILGLVWIASLIFGFAPFFVGRTVYLRKDGLYCQVPLNLSRTYIITVCCMALFPFSFLLIVNYRIFKIAKYHSNRISAEIQSVQRNYQTPANLQFAKDRKAHRMVSLTMGTFILFWTPLYLVMLVDVIKKDAVNSYIYAGAVMFAMVNSGLNPITYAVTNKEYRLTFKFIIQCIRTRKLPPVASINPPSDGCNVAQASLFSRSSIHCDGILSSYRATTDNGPTPVNSTALHIPFYSKY